MHAKEMKNVEHKGVMKYDKKNELEWHRVVKLKPNEIVIFKQSLKEMVELTIWISERSIPDRGNSQWKDRKAGGCPVVLGTARSQCG